MVPVSLEATSIAQATLEAVSVFWPQPPKCQDCKCEPSFLSYFLFILCMWPVFFPCMYVCILQCACALCVWLVSTEARRGPRMEVMNRCELPSESWGLNPRSSRRAASAFNCCTNHWTISLDPIFMRMCLHR